MPKKPVIKKTLSIPLWERDIILVIGCDYDYVKNMAISMKLSKDIIDEIMEDHLDPKTTAGCAYFCLEKGEGIVWFPFKRVAGEVLAHEVTHIVDELMKFIGAQKECEARAYTVEWLFKIINKVLNRQIK